MKFPTFIGLLFLAPPSLCCAAEGSVPTGVPPLDHVFVIMMENHNIDQILGNANAPFINGLARSANLASNYYAIAHPSLTNYLETVGGSNFGVLSDNPPDWHNATCLPNLATKLSATTNPASPPICPISGVGSDAATPAIDFSGNVTRAPGPPGEINIDGILSVPAASDILGITIADQLEKHGRSWKSYEEDLPQSGADFVSYSDGVFTNKTDFSHIAAPSPALSQSDVVQLYAVKHNPFAYFKSTQEAGLENMAGFDGQKGLFADLAGGTVPAFSFIAPNQCNDQHGRGNAGAVCKYDSASDGTPEGLNPALLIRADEAVSRLVSAIHSSPIWKTASAGGTPSRSAIILLWDENDYGAAPEKNRVLLIVDTNYGVHSLQSSVFYTHFSFLKSLEAGFGLPCLNHACDSGVEVMSDLFAEK